MSEPRRYLTPAQQRDVSTALDEIDRTKQNRPAPTTVSTTEVFRLYTPDELLQFPEPAWLVEPFIVAGGITVLFGASGTYKSFTAVDWAARSPGVTVYLSGEGSPNKLGQRVKAWEKAAGRPAEIVVHPFSIDLLTEAAAFIAAIRRSCEPRPGLLVVDTASRNMVGDENKTPDMAAFVAALDRIRGEFGCGVLVIHHTGHENTDRERGSSALRGAADVSIRAKKDGPLVVRLSCAKMRDSDEFAASVVRLERLDGTLVACEAVSTKAAIFQAVAEYRRHHPEASQNEVEEAIKGRRDTIRAAFRQLSQGAPGAPNPMGAPPDKVRPDAPPLKGARAQSHDRTLDPTEHRRLVEDGGWG
jgi:AAA domain